MTNEENKGKYVDEHCFLVYTINRAYRYLLNDEETSEKIVLYMQADDKGKVYLTNFMADDYGMFSKEDSSAKVLTRTTNETAKKIQTVKNIFGEDVSFDRIYWTKNSQGEMVQKALITFPQGESYETQLIEL